jgi:hypothetical protein
MYSDEAPPDDSIIPCSHCSKQQHTEVNQASKGRVSYTKEHEMEMVKLTPYDEALTKQKTLIQSGKKTIKSIFRYPSGTCFLTVLAFWATVALRSVHCVADKVGMDPAAAAAWNCCRVALKSE